MSVFRQRRGTAAALAAANETPASGQIVFEIDTNRIKIGDGVRPYNSLAYLDNEIAVTDVVGLRPELNGLQAAVTAIHADARWADQRTPLDGSVTAAKLATGLLIDGPRYQHRRGSLAELTASNPTPAAGELVHESDTNRVKVGDGARAYISLPYLATGQMASEVTPAAVLDNLTFDGTTAAFTMRAGGVAITPPTYAYLLISLNGVIQRPGVSYTTAGSLLTFASPPAASDQFFGVFIAGSAPHQHSGSDIVSGTISADRLPGTVVYTTDSRLADSRPPTSHKASHQVGGADALSPADIGAAAAAHVHDVSAVTGLQAALDGKQPAGAYAAAVHSHAAADIISGVLALDRIPATVVRTTDSRLADDRFPLAHRASHSTGGNDALSPADIGAASVIHTHLISDIYGLPAALSERAYATHEHDARYYTQSQLVTMLAGKQAAGSYAAATHGHAVADVSGLQTALDGKASLSHTHSALSGDITGLATVATSGSAADLSGTLAAARLPNTTVTAGSYGSASSVATYTVDAAGRLTAAGSTAIAISAGAVSGLAAVATSGAYSSLTGTPTTLPPTDGSVTDASITSGGLSASSINWAAIQPWQANTAYQKGDLVSNAGIAYRRSVAGTSGATFNVANWQQITPSEFVASQITSGTVATARLGSGSPSSANYLRGDGAWTAAPVTSVDGSTGAVTVTKSAVYDFTRTSSPSGATGSAGAGYTFTLPTWARSLTIVCVGSGAGGGSGRRGAAGTNRGGGGGGGSGETKMIALDVADLSSTTLWISVSPGGAGGAAVTADDTNGNAGTYNDWTFVRYTNGSGAIVVAACPGNSGGGGSASGGSGGGGSNTNVGPGQINAGGAGGTTTGNSNNTGQANASASSGGSGGGGVNSSNTHGAGGANRRQGGENFYFPDLAGGAAGGGAGNNGVVYFLYGGRCGQGGSGGGGNSAGAGGDGGNGATPGGGGGGGGASVNGFSSGKGGNGGDGFVRLIVWG